MIEYILGTHFWAVPHCRISKLAVIGEDLFVQWADEIYPLHNLISLMGFNEKMAEIFKTCNVSDEEQVYFCTLLDKRIVREPDWMFTIIDIRLSQK